MITSRRQLLGVGAAVAASLTASSCRADEPTTLATSDAGRTPKVAPGGHLPLDLPRGALYYGASLAWYRSLPAWERRLGRTLALHRSYFEPGRNSTPAQLVASVADDLAHRRMPHVSIKPPGTWRDVATGQCDEWLTSMLQPLGEHGGTAFLTIHHEPENDVHPDGNTAPDFVEMQRRVIERAAELAPQVVVVPVLQHWTFDPAHVDGDPAAWLVPEAKVMGLDVYNPWSPMRRSTWRTFGSKLDEVIGWFEGKPLVIGEHGCRVSPDNPGLAAQWLHDAVEYARGHRIISLSYFNSRVNTTDGTWELRGETQAAFSELLAADWVARPPRVPKGDTVA